MSILADKYMSFIISAISCAEVRAVASIWDLPFHRAVLVFVGSGCLVGDFLTSCPTESSRFSCAWQPQRVVWAPGGSRCARRCRALGSPAALTEQRALGLQRLGRDSGDRLLFSARKNPLLMWIKKTKGKTPCFLFSWFFLNSWLAGYA